MKVVVAPTAFKWHAQPDGGGKRDGGGLRQAQPGAECDLCPLSDGGDGFLEAVGSALGVERARCWCAGRATRPSKATFGLHGGDLDSPWSRARRLSA